VDPMIPFYSFKDIHFNIENDLFNSAKKVIQSGNYVFGTDKFEEEFAAYVGSKYCVAVSNGTSALHLALLSLGISEGDEVITVSHTFRATSAAVDYCGAIPIFVDIDPNTFTMDFQQIESKITNKTKCILPVHIYGNASAMKNIISIANKYNIPVIEDCSQAHGTTINGKHVGTFGKLGTFSFYPGKGLGALGDAGCIVTDDEFLANNLKKNRSWDDNEIGFNYRMANIQAEFLRIKLKNFNSVLKEKQHIADQYNKHFSFVKCDKDVNHSFHIYPILHKNRDTLINKVKDKLELKVHYPIPVHRLPRYKQSYSLPITEKIASEEVSLPIYPGVDYNNVIEIVSSNL
jgi:dTDP-4-amino-4,6-dideoxygalactose transaminase